MKVTATILAASLISLATPLADALTPKPDTTPEFFAGEWIGLGPSNTFCRLSLDKSGRGALRVRSSTSRVSEIKIEKWVNQSQYLQVLTSTTPIEIRNQSNGTFVLTTSGAVCQMARASDFDGFLKN
ncbi:MAG: hypothetical protein U1E10_17280 [Bdellovibrionales bacterium]|nr:hypothetical protein [Bdellovibrionales bacterium]